MLRVSLWTRRPLGAALDWCRQKLTWASIREVPSSTAAPLGLGIRRAFAPKVARKECSLSNYQDRA
eukprot:6598356-Pyramimonas_sp.AAC.1